MREQLAMMRANLPSPECRCTVKAHQAPGGVMWAEIGGWKRVNCSSRQRVSVVGWVEWQENPRRVPVLCRTV